MKKIIIAMAAIAAAFTMASCNKEQPVSPNENPTVGKSVITATIENDATKTALTPDKDGYKVVWSEGDKIYVGDYDYEYWEAEYTLDKSSAGSSKGAFIWQKGDYINSICEEYEEPVFEEGEKYVAVHPFDLVDENNNEYLIWKTEQTYSDTDRYIPMYAEAECTKDGEADFIFANLGGLLQLTVYGSATISSIKISAAEKEGMSGAFNLGHDVNGVLTGQIMYGSENTVNYITLDCGEGGVELSRDGTDFYISMPCHYTIKGVDMIIDGYPGVTITLTDTEGRTCVKKLNNKNLVIERSKITTATFTASEFKTNVPEGALPGEFSVSADKQVYFSKGNLYADGDNALHFEAYQYTTPSSWDASHVSHFTWSSTVAAAVGEDNDGDYLFCDENHKVAVNGSEAIYYALSMDEWTYLFSYGDHDNDTRRGKYKWATVNGVNGYVIAPDGFAGTLADTYADDAALAAGNLVFLPAAGERYGSDVYFVGNYSFYWSSSAHDESLAGYVYNAYPGHYGSRYYGYSVRLVTDVK